MDAAPEPYPGETLGLPASGAGSLARWGTRVAALLIDWAACMLVAIGFFGPGVLRESGWKQFAILGLFFLETAVLTALTGGSFGQLIARIGIVRLDGSPPGWVRAFARAAMISVVVPTLVIGAERRALNDLLLGTVVVNRR